MRKALVILGPTSTGKTDLALQLAKKYTGELVSCDSRQIYTNLDIGTGKYPNLNIKYPVRGEARQRRQISNIKKKKSFWEINGIKIWMYDVVEPKKQYTVYNFVKDANRVIDNILKREKLPIIVGGTGFYLKALLEGLPSLTVPMDLKLRKELEKLPLEKLQKRLQKISLSRWEKMSNSDRQNPRRLVRAIEIASTDFTSEESSSTSLRTTVRGGFKILKIGLAAPRAILYQRIDERVVSRINQGMIDEAKKLHKSGLSFKRMRQLGLEYGILADYLENKLTGTDELIKIMQGKIHGFARRQLTWFKNPSASSGYIYWFDITKAGWADQVEKRINSWYYSTCDQTH